MHFRGVGFRSVALAVGLLTLASSVAFGQATRPRAPGAPGGTAGAAQASVVRIRDLTGVGPRALVRTAEYSTSVSRGRTAARLWAETSVTYDTDPEWLDELTFQYYVLVYDKAKDEHSLFKGVVTYVDVARGKGHVSPMYLRPSTLARYGEVVGVAVEILHQGSVVATEANGRQGKGQPLPPEWWKVYQGTVREGVLLDRSRTPFALVNVDDFETIK
jgi:hypothetical protein